MDWLEYENKNIARGFLSICGVDEAGRGPLAGPVCAAAVILPENTVIEGVNDSKKLSEKKREVLFDVIKEQALAYSIAFASVEEIEELKKDFVAVEEQVSLFEKVDTEGVEPMVYPFEAPTTFLREDVVSDVLTQEEALKNVKDARMGHVHVPKVVK